MPSGRPSTRRVGISGAFCRIWLDVLGAASPHSNAFLILSYAAELALLAAETVPVKRVTMLHRPDLSVKGLDPEWFGPKPPATPAAYPPLFDPTIYRPQMVRLIGNALVYVPAMISAPNARGLHRLPSLKTDGPIPLEQLTKPLLLAELDPLRLQKTLNSYRGARSRCMNPKDPSWPLYGGRVLHTDDGLEVPVPVLFLFPGPDEFVATIVTTPSFIRSSIYLRVSRGLHGHASTAWPKRPLHSQRNSVETCSGPAPGGDD